MGNSGIMACLKLFFCEMSSMLCGKYSAKWGVQIGELYLVLSAHGTKDSNLYMFISSGKIADINETNDLMESYPMLSQEIEAKEKAVVWWESEEDTYSIFVRSSRFGIVLEQKEIIFTRKKDNLYKTEIRNVLFFYKDIFLIIGISVLFISILLYLHLQVTVETRQGGDGV